jgi:hypothetical protein
MTTKADILAMANGLQAQANDLVCLIETWDEKEQPPDAVTVNFTVKSDRALARFIYGWNSAPKSKGGPFPIMQIYPGDSKVEGRVKYFKGVNVRVFPPIVKADSNENYYEIASSPVAGVRLFIRASDGILA